jgi:ribosomal protein L37AE/L43A
MAKRFSKKIEDFVCRRCDTLVIGNGYTNHCPKCLWSRHVDNNPGDREAACGGMMEPIGIKTAAADQTVVHRCVICAKEKTNRLSRGDNFEKVIEISRTTV